jgi:uncharacterized RmlC-like cupin family protein
MATLIRSKDVKLNATYDPHLPCGEGIESSTVPETTFRMHYLIVPPGKRSYAHYHCDTAAGNYIVKGHLRIYIGPLYDQQIFDVEAGDFIHIPKGEIHYSENLSDTEPVELISCYPDVATREAAGRVYVEPPKKK